MIHTADLKTVTLTFITILLYTSSAAQEAKLQAITDDTLKQPLIVKEVLLPEIQIEAYHTISSLKSIPGSLSVRSKSDLDNHSYPSLLPSLSNIPGVYIHQGTFNTNRITIRGIGARIPYATGRIRAYFDEIPLTNGSGYSMVEYIDPVFADQVQVVKSPSTSAYGAGLGGTILIRSKSPDNYYPNILAEFQAGAWGLLNTTLALEEKINRHSFRIAYSNGSMDGYRDNNAMSRQMAGVIWHFAPNNNHLLSIKLMLHEMYAQIPSSIDSLNFFDNPGSAAANWLKTKGFEEGRRAFGSLNHTYRNKAALLKTSIFYNISEESEVRPFDMFDENRTLAGIRSTFTQTVQQLDIKLSASTGFEAMAEKVHFANRQNIKGEGIAGDPIGSLSESILSVGLFTQLDISFGRNRINAGLHLHQLDNTFENISYIQAQQLTGKYHNGLMLSPRLGFNRELSARHHLYASVNHGFSPPSLTETLNPDGKVNPDIKAEKSYTWDAGWRGSLPKYASWFDIGLFFMNITDLLVAERIGDDAWVGRNAGKAKHFGFEAEIKTNLYSTAVNAQPTSQLIQAIQLQLNAQLGKYHFTDFVDKGEDRSGNRIPGIPSSFFNMMIQIKVYKGIYVVPSIVFTGSMALNDANTKYSDSYMLINLRAGYKNTGKKAVAEMYLQANNLGNKHYAAMLLVNAPGVRNQRYYYPGLPIHLNAGISIRWNYRQG